MTSTSDSSPNSKRTRCLANCSSSTMSARIFIRLARSKRWEHAPALSERGGEYRLGNLGVQLSRKRNFGPDHRVPAVLLVCWQARFHVVRSCLSPRLASPCRCPGQLGADAYLRVL